MQYRHTPDMGRISAYDDAHEQCCQDMLDAGVRWLKEHPEARIELGQIGAFAGPRAKNADANAIDRVLLDAAAGRPAWVMHDAILLRLLFIQQFGWEEYCRRAREMQPAPALEPSHTDEPAPRRWFDTWMLIGGLSMAGWIGIAALLAAS